MIVIVDYGVGNVGSIANMLKKVGAPVQIGRTGEELSQARKLILPGVGAFDNGMSNLRARGLVPILNELVLQRKVPILGICLGMHLFANRSEEGQEQGLGWIDAEVVRFNFGAGGERLKVPHMGWNSVTLKGEVEESIVPQPSRFYFVHAYHLACKNDEDVAGRTLYGYQFDSVVRRNNIHGVQFHPEKSLRFGMELLGRFWSAG
jgi:imidazole glycerol-phosphate synthase subunit HisH